MCRLCYLYIEEFKALRGAELVFDHRYDYQLEGGVLKITDNKSLTDDFFGESIYSLTAIVGKNGCGKSTAMEALMRIVVDGWNDHYGFNYLLIVSIGGTIQCERHLSSPIDVEYNGVGVQETYHRVSIETFFYSGHFSGNFGSSSICTKQLAGSYNASDQYRLQEDLQNYANQDTFHLSLPFAHHADAYQAQNNYRICRLLADNALRNSFKDIKLPKYIVIGANRSGEIANSLKSKQEKFDIPKYTTGRGRNGILRFLVFHSLVNTLVDSFHNPLDTDADKDKQVVLSLLNEWAKVQDDGKAVEDQLNTLKSSQKGNLSENNITKRLQNITKFIALIEKEWSFDERYNQFYIDVETSAGTLANLLATMRKHDSFFVARYFDFYYSHSLSSQTNLSSGELEMFNLFSRIYAAVVTNHEKASNAIHPTLFLLDEAEIGYHPEWQRKYVNLVVDFMNALYKGKGIKVQVILTSHSPIILSDIPKRCANFLEQTEDGTKNRRAQQEETFAQNIFELYRRSFFINEGLIGEFAERKIASLREKMESPNVSEAEAHNALKVVGDPFIKNYLLKVWEDNHRQEAISYYKKRLQELDRSETNDKED